MQTLIVNISFFQAELPWLLWGRFSGVTDVCLTRCGNWWCRPIFPPKTSHRPQKWWPFFSHRHHSRPLRFPSRL